MKYRDRETDIHPGQFPLEITRESRPIRPGHSRRLDCHKLFHVFTFHNKPLGSAGRETARGAVAPSDRIHSKQK